jgi:hypothetical protein
MKTEISHKFAALAIALSINGLLIGSVAYLFNSAAQQHVPVVSLAQTQASVTPSAQS